jgi:hypothetical protein
MFGRFREESIFCSSSVIGTDPLACARRFFASASFVGSHRHRAASALESRAFANKSAPLHGCISAARLKCSTRAYAISVIDAPQTFNSRVRVKSFCSLRITAGCGILIRRTTKTLKRGSAFVMCWLAIRPSNAPGRNTSRDWIGRLMMSSGRTWGVGFSTTRPHGPCRAISA